jgi:hypothetical protein
MTADRRPPKCFLLAVGSQPSAVALKSDCPGGGSGAINLRRGGKQQQEERSRLLLESYTHYIWLCQTLKRVQSAAHLDF